MSFIHIKSLHDNKMINVNFIESFYMGDYSIFIKTVSETYIWYEIEKNYKYKYERKSIPIYNLERQRLEQQRCEQQQREERRSILQSKFEELKSLIENLSNSNNLIEFLKYLPHTVIVGSEVKKVEDTTNIGKK